MKQCKGQCKQWKNESEFSHNRTRRDGLQKWCKDCQRQYSIDHPRDHHAIWERTKELKFTRMLNAS